MIKTIMFRHFAGGQEKTKVIHTYIQLNL